MTEDSPKSTFSTTKYSQFTIRSTEHGSEGETDTPPTNSTGTSESVFFPNKDKVSVPGGKEVGSPVSGSSAWTKSEAKSNEDQQSGTNKAAEPDKSEDVTMKDTDETLVPKPSRAAQILLLKKELNDEVIPNVDTKLQDVVFMRKTYPQAMTDACIGPCYEARLHRLINAPVKVEDEFKDVHKILDSLDLDKHVDNIVSMTKETKQMEKENEEMAKVIRENNENLNLVRVLKKSV